MTRFRAPLATGLAIFALIAQMLATPFHRMPAHADIVTVSANLKALFGDGAILCVQAEDGKNTPAPTRDCDDSCPLCQFHSVAHALVLPTLAGLPTRIDAGAQALALAPAPVSLKPRAGAFAQPRAPPLVA